MADSRLVQLLQRLTGETVPFASALAEIPLTIGPGLHGLGYSQLNELLLIGGLDRITHTFFAYLLNGSTSYEPGSAFESIEELERGVARFRTTALLNYGNVKFAFKSLSQDNELLRRDIAEQMPVDTTVFERRHEPVLPIQQIAPEEAYLTGYLIESDLRVRLQSDPLDTEAQALEGRRREVVKIALANQAAYLASDHLDVYVATSMRARHEFISIGRVVREIFEDPAVKPLKLRWFDPTQAYCSNRIDKGLAEGLMLRRASCTIYLAQESDTLGKDSELASTLAQGKPVVAFVPEIDETYFASYLATITAAEPEKSLAELLLGQLQLFEPSAAWFDAQIREWSASPQYADLPTLRERVYQRIRSHYDKRAHTLRETHPLGIQVNLQTGVANGVMVVRRSSDCARLVRGVITRTLTFSLEEDSRYTALRESISGDIFRVMTADPVLTNTFWNFYRDPVD